MANTADMFSKGDMVNVTVKPDDLFNHDFTGNVKYVIGDIVGVVDGDGDVFDVDPDQVSFNTDDIMN